MDDAPYEIHTADGRTLVATAWTSRGADRAVESLQCEYDAPLRITVDTAYVAYMEPSIPPAPNPVSVAYENLGDEIDRLERLASTFSFRASSVANAEESAVIDALVYLRRARVCLRHSLPL